MKASIIGGIVMLVVLGALYVLTGSSDTTSVAPAAPAEQPAPESGSAFKL